MLSSEYPTRTGKLRFLTLDSHLLAGNRYGDPSIRHHPVFLPPSYECEPDRRYPVVFGLAGYTATGLHMVSPGTFSESLLERLDRLMAGGMPEIIFVAVEAMTHLGGSQFLNGACGPYEDSIIQELIPAVDQQLRTTGSHRGRAILGKSSGGFGALQLAMRHPELFSAVACHSGDAGFEQCYLPEIPRLIRALDSFAGDEPQKITAFLESFWKAKKKSYDDGHALMMLACSAAYSPDPASPTGFHLPCHVETGALKDDTWSRWLSFDPVRCVENHVEALRSIPLIWIECGRRDQYGLQLGARQLHARLQALEIRHRYDEFDDDHSGIQYRYDLSLPEIARTLVAVSDEEESPQ